MGRWHIHTIAVVMTVKNDPVGCAVTLSSLAAQTRRPEEIIVVDGGSTDQTRHVIRQYTDSMPQLRVIESPGANIARGRNIGTAAAKSEIIATTDAGCRAEPTWIESLLTPFREDAGVEFVAGFYRIEPHTLIEHVVGLATMPGQLAPVKEQTFNPSARSMALTKALWSRAGGWPECIDYSEDTLFDHKIRRMGAGWKFAGDAIVHWRPRGDFWSIARQFYNYGTGRGLTQIDARAFVYTLRNVLILLGTCVLCLITLWALPLPVLAFGYFFVWAFHDKAAHIARRTGRRLAHPLCLVVMWVVMISNLAGYLVGSCERKWKRGRYHDRVEAYLAAN